MAGCGTRDEVLAELARTGPDAAGHNDQSGVRKIAEAPTPARIDPGLLPGRTGPGIASVDFVYPSVERGGIDPGRCRQYPGHQRAACR